MNAWIHVAGWTLVHFVWQGTLLGLAAAAALRTMRGTAPQARYVFACVVLAAMLASPVITVSRLSGSPDVVAVASATIGAASRTGTNAAARALPGRTADPVRVDDALDIPASVAAPGAWPPILVGSWLAGVAILFTRLLGGWWRVRRLHRTALAAEPSRWTDAGVRIAGALKLHRCIRIVDWPAIDTPTVIGFIRPVIVLPIVALSNLTPAQVDAILAHELAHVRRHDFAVNLLQTLVETLLFYHPAVWWLSARIRAEREHCCDLVAVRVCGDPVSYAEALTELEAWRTSGTALAIAATGGSLLDRVRRVLGAPADDAPRSVGATSLAVLGVLILLIAAATGARATQKTGEGPTAAAPAPDDREDGEAWSVLFNHTTQQLRFLGFTGRDLIRFAHQLPGERVLGGPSWMDDETFTLVMDLDAPPAADDMPALVRRLLADRFRLQSHVETRDFPAYDLVLARADGSPGPNLRTSSIDCFDTDTWIAAGQPPREIRSGAARQPVCGEEDWNSTIARTSFVAISMKQLAAQLSGFSELAMVHGRPWPHTLRVIDRTGLEGRFDVDIYAFQPAVALMTRYPALEPLFARIGLPSIAAALEQQLGLRLEEATAPDEVIVIDHAERPGGQAQ